MRIRRKRENGDSKKALEDSKEQLRKVASRDREVNLVANSLKAARQRNHFADQLELMIVGHNRRAR